MAVKNDMPALMVAASEGSLEVLQLILDAQPDFLLVDLSGRTALHFACAAGSHKKIAALIKHVKSIWEASESQKYINARTSGGNTPLMLAVQSGDIHSIAGCINAGCNPFLENGLRERPLDLAKQYPEPKLGVKIAEFIAKSEA